MAKHQDLSAEYAHIPGYYQASDPGAIGPGKLWIDTNGGPGNWVMKLRNAGDDGWETISSGGGYTDHGVLTGLADDDHSQYHTDARGDARYSQLGHTHTESDITDLGSYLDQAAADLLYAALVHTHVEADITDLQSYSLVGHTHTEADITDLGSYLDQATADTLYAPLSHNHAVADITDFDPADYLPLAGGNMLGNLTSDGEIETDVGFYLRDGLTKVTVAEIGASLDIGDAAYAIDLLGSAVRPKYNGADLALLSDTGGGGVTDHGALTGLGDDDHPQYLNETRGDARYAQTGDLADYLPLTGGVLSGYLDFNDANEGIRFNDGAGTFFDGLTFDLAGGFAPEIIIGAEAPDTGGNPAIRANSFVFRIGQGAGAGFAALEMWNEGDASYEAIIQSVSDNPGDPLDLGSGNHAINLNGSETRPTYNGGELALLTDIGGTSYDPTDVPRMQAGSGYAHISYINAVSVDVYAPGAPGAAVRISPRDFINFIRGGTATLYYKMEIDYWQTPGGNVPQASAYNTDATAAYIDLTDCDLNIGYVVVKIFVKDSVGNEQWVECALVLTDNQGLFSP